MKGLLIDLLGAMLALSGAGSPEELSEYEAERFAHYAEHQLALNNSSRSRLLSSGLFSAYQVAAIEEYRKRYGDILSLAELALVDGIGPSTAEALGFFVSFGSSLPPGARERRWVRQSLMIRGAARARGTPVQNGWAERDTAFAAGAKYHLEIGERAEFFWSSRTTYSSPEQAPGTFSIALSSRRGARLLLGDYAARFGQGLILWSSFSMSGFGSVAAFRRNASGFAPTGSYSPSLSGAALDFPAGRWNFGAALVSDALRSFLSGAESAVGDVAPVPVVHTSYFGRRGQFGVQALYRDGTVVSADGTLGLGHWSLFGEAALSSVLIKEDGFVLRRSRAAAVGGVRWAPAYKLQFAALARYYPAGFYSPYSGAPRSASKVSDETGVSLGAQWRWAELTLDAARHPEKGTSQYRVLVSSVPEFSLFGGTLWPALRWTEKYRPSDREPWRHEIRADIKYTHGIWSATFRGHLVRCKELGALGYAELGAVGLQYSAYVRLASFRADNWADRIYCYERDLPGAFSVPAFSGHGWSVSATAGLKIRRQKLSLKSSFLRRAYKSSQESIEIKIQYQIDF